MLISTAFKIKTNKQNLKKDGTTPIYLYLNIEGKRSMIPTGKYIPPHLFDNERGMVKRGGGETIKLNSVLDQFKSRYIQAIYDLEFRNKKVSFEALDSIINNKCQDDFFDFAYKELKEMSFSASPKYYEILEYHLGTLKKYRQKINFEEINYTFLNEYQNWLTKRGLKINSISGAFRCIRLFVNKARKKEMISNNPFLNFKIRTQNSKIEYLTLDEIIKLNDLYDCKTLSDKLQNTLHYFLISCYTGLRRSDCSRLEKHHIEGDTLRILPKKTQKTGKEIRIPLSNRVQKLLDVESNSFFARPLKQSHSRTINDIKEILKELKITKHITFHCSRHSFAINCLGLGIPIEVVSSILGHSSIKTTQIYAKVVDDLKTREMKKWDF